MLTLAICGLHFTAMGAVTIAPDPTVLVPASPLDDTFLALSVAAAAILVLLSGTTAAALSEGQLRRQSEDELRLQNERFKAALSNMGEGLCMFDAGKRLVVCNDRYASLYQLPPALLQPGTPHADIIAHRVSQGVLKGATNALALEEKCAALDQLPMDQRSSRIEQLADGRLICVTREPMAGGGWVATHNDVTEQRRYEARIAHMALHDALTGLANRTCLNDHLQQAMAVTERGGMLAALILDLDQFKHVNDTLGHAIGDKLLQMVGKRLRDVARDTDTIARMGGDEFAILQRGLTGPEDAGALAERIIAAISVPYECDGHQMVIGTSVGIAIGPADGETPEELIKKADLALYRAKAAGRSTFRYFERGMDVEIQERRSLEQALRRGLAAGEFQLHYQPMIDVASDRINGFEALIRWQRPGRGMVSPATFIPLAEETGLIVPLGEWIIREACAAAAQWPPHIKIAVNLSPAQLRSGGLFQAIASALLVSGVAPSRLELEITETALLQDGEGSLAVLHKLREIGVRIAMDDFGTGYSSLSHLQRFPFDKIKIDRSFVQKISSDVSWFNIVRAVAALAKGLGASATAEGVETQEQLASIKAEGCSEVQGFLLSRPMPGHEVDALLHVRRTAEHAAVA